MCGGVIMVGEHNVWHLVEGFRIVWYAIREWFKTGKPVQEQPGGDARTVVLAESNTVTR